jgi:hypothetical protein
LLKITVPLADRGPVTLFSTKTIFGGCNLPLDGRRFRRLWPFSRLSIQQDRIVVQALGTRHRWEAKYDEIHSVELIQLSFGQGARFGVPEGDWYIYTYESGDLALELTKAGVSSPTGVTRLKLVDLPK